LGYLPSELAVAFCPTAPAETKLATLRDFALAQAANDSEFHRKPRRKAPTVAIVSTIANYPSKLRILLTNASRYWQVRCFLKGKTYTQSLKIANKQVASHSVLPLRPKQDHRRQPSH